MEKTEKNLHHLCSYLARKETAKMATPIAFLIQNLSNSELGMMRRNLGKKQVEKGNLEARVNHVHEKLALARRLNSHSPSFQMVIEARR